jgi:hypothetical protein
MVAFYYGFTGVARVKKPSFFRNERRMVFGDPIEVVTPEAQFAPADSML